MMTSQRFSCGQAQYETWESASTFFKYVYGTSTPKLGSEVGHIEPIACVVWKLGHDPFVQKEVQLYHNCTHSQGTYRSTPDGFGSEKGTQYPVALVGFHWIFVLLMFNGLLLFAKGCSNEASTGHQTLLMLFIFQQFAPPPPRCNLLRNRQWKVIHFPATYRGSE